MAGAELLAREGRIRKRVGGGLYFHQLSEGARGLLRRGGYLNDIGDESHFYGSKADAISGIFERLDKNICKRCDKRIFNECKTVPREEEETEATGEKKQKSEAVAAD